MTFNRILPVKNEDNRGLVAHRIARAIRHIGGTDQDVERFIDCDYWTAIRIALMIREIHGGCFEFEVNYEDLFEQRPVSLVQFFSEGLDRHPGDDDSNTRTERVVGRVFYYSRDHGYQALLQKMKEEGYRVGTRRELAAFKAAFPKRTLVNYEWGGDILGIRTVQGLGLFPKYPCIARELPWLSRWKYIAAFPSCDLFCNDRAIVSVDYREDLNQLCDELKFKLGCGPISEEILPLGTHKRGVMVFEAKLYSVHGIELRDVPKIMENDGFRPASFREVLRLVKKFSHELRRRLSVRFSDGKVFGQCGIVVLHAISHKPDGYRDLPVIQWNEKGEPNHYFEWKGRVDWRGLNQFSFGVREIKVG